MRYKNVLQYLEHTAARLPEKIAFSDGREGETLTFSQTLDLARRMASLLLRCGMCGKRVLLMMDRRPTAIAAMLGVWYAGACSISADATLPAARLQDMIDRADVAMILADEAYAERAEQLLDGRVQTVRAACACEIDEVALNAVRSRQIDTDPIYMVFTSGSTGRPKGVIACHRSVIDYAEALLPALAVEEDDVFGCQSPLYFDAPLKEILSTLVRGATTYLIPRRCFSFPMLLLDYIREQGINSVCWVVSAFLQISALGALEQHPPRSLRRVVFGSEVFPREHYDRWRAALPDAVFYHLYGPTEATGMSCIWRADRPLAPGERIPIGAPLDNTDLLLIDPTGARVLPCATGESGEGEIYLRGSCVTLGYDHAPEETAAAFVQNPLQSAYPETVYRTGDLACYNACGELVFLGRKDAQIKRMGHRVELGEIEEAAMRIEGVREAICVFSPTTRELLLAFVGDADGGEVIGRLRDCLPRYMLPLYARRVALLPHTANGKKDRRTLLAQLESDPPTSNE